MRFSTVTVDRRSQLSYWHDVVCATFVRLGVERLKPRAEGFRAEVTAQNLGGLQVATVIADPHAVYRTPAMIRGSPDDDFMVNLAIRGRTVVSQDGREAALRPGDFTVHDSARPCRIVCPDPFRLLILKVPRDVFTSRCQLAPSATAVAVAGDRGAARDLFGESRLPTLVQHDPYQRFFEARDGTLLFSGDNGVPLVRYHIADEGGVIAFDDMMAFCAAHGFDPLAAGLDRGVHRMPFVFVFGRSHFTVSYFGANIYPENVTVGLEQPEINGWVTGKFVLEVLEDADRDRHLSVTVELAPGEQDTPERAGLAAGAITAQLRALNSEFAHYVPEDRQAPQVRLLPAGDPRYFPRGVKHRYTRGPARPPA